MLAQNARFKLSCAVNVLLCIYLSIDDRAKLETKTEF